MPQTYYGRPGTTHKVDFTASSVASSSAFGSTTSVVMLCAKTAGCHFHIASVPVATTSLSFLPKDTVMYVQVNGGDKIAAIREASTSGSLFATELI
jgi:hypothetical protein